MSARRRIFEAIERAIGPARSREAIRAEAEALLADPQAVRPALPDRSAVELFIEAVERLPPGASVERLESFAAVPEAVARRLTGKGLPAELKIQPITLLAGLDWAAAGIRLTEEVDDRAALSLAETAIAETASLVLRSGPAMPILDAFLPLHHIVAVRAEDVIRHLEDALAAADLARSRNLVLVTGPSGTTDIEGSLVIGVHGPGTLHILVVG